MKRIVFLLFAIVLCLSACSETSNSDESSEVVLSESSDISSDNSSKTSSVESVVESAAESVVESSVESSTPDVSEDSSETINFPEDSKFAQMQKIEDDGAVEVIEYTGGLVTVKNNTDKDITSLKIAIAAFDRNGAVIQSGGGQYAIISPTSGVDANETLQMRIIGIDVKGMVAYEAIVCSYSTADGQYVNEHFSQWERLCFGMISDDQEPKEPQFAEDCALYQLRALEDNFNVKIVDVDVNEGNFIFEIKNESGSNLSTLTVALFAVDENGKYIELVKNSPCAKIILLQSVADGGTIYYRYTSEHIDKVAGYVAIVTEYKTNDGTVVKNPIEGDWNTICLAEMSK